jgi:predicted nucleic acid-binding protein
MATVARYLADTSALARLRHPPVAEALGSLIETGLVATCGVIEFELAWATRTAAEFSELRADRDAGYEWLATHDEDWRRALEVQAVLWQGGKMRSVGLPDLLIAAVAERQRSHFPNQGTLTGDDCCRAGKTCCALSRWGSLRRPSHYHSDCPPPSEPCLHG